MRWNDWKTMADAPAPETGETILVQRAELWPSITTSPLSGRSSPPSSSAAWTCLSRKGPRGRRPPPARWRGNALEDMDAGDALTEREMHVLKADGGLRGAIEHGFRLGLRLRLRRARPCGTGVCSRNMVAMAKFQPTRRICLTLLCGAALPAPVMRNRRRAYASSRWATAFPLATGCRRPPPSRPCWSGSCAGRAWRSPLRTPGCRAIRRQAGATASTGPWRTGRTS